MLEITTSSSVIGAYIPDGEDIYNNKIQSTKFEDKNLKYIPLLNDFSIPKDGGFVFVDPLERKNNIKSHNGYIDITSPSNKIKEATRIDITRNDIKFGSDVLILNFTNSNITASSSTEIRKLYPPIKSSRFPEFSGKIVFLEITSLNTMEFVRTMDGFDDYFTVIMDDIRKRVEIDERVLAKTLNIYKTAKDLSDKVLLNDGKVCSNSIKVVSVLEIEGDNAVEVLRGSQLFIPEYGCVISSCKINDLHTNPLATRNISLTLEEIRTMENNNLTVMINDPDNKIGKRYMYIGGSVIEIPKISNPALPAGIKINIRGFSAKDNSGLEKPLDEIDQLNFIYSNREEAEHGADRITNMENKLKEMKLIREQDKEKYEKEKLEIERKLDDERRAWEREKQERESVKKNAEFDADAFLASLERERELIKQETLRNQSRYDRENNEMKFNYELNKASNEATIQTLKVIGGALALVGIGYAIYKKYS